MSACSLFKFQCVRSQTRKFSHLTRVGCEQFMWSITTHEIHLFAFTTAIKHFHRKDFIHLTHILERMSSCIFLFSHVSTKYLQSALTVRLLFELLSFTGDRRHFPSMTETFLGEFLHKSYNSPCILKWYRILVHEHLVLGMFLSPSFCESWYLIAVSHSVGLCEQLALGQERKEENEPGFSDRWMTEELTRK